MKMKKARLITKDVFGKEHYTIETFNNETKTWDMCWSYAIERQPKEPDYKLINPLIIDRIFSLIYQGYTIIDER